MKRLTGVTNSFVDRRLWLQTRSDREPAVIQMLVDSATPIFFHNLQETYNVAELSFLYSRMRTKEESWITKSIPHPRARILWTGTYLPTRSVHQSFVNLYLKRSTEIPFVSGLVSGTLSVSSSGVFVKEVRKRPT